MKEKLLLGFKGSYSRTATELGLRFILQMGKVKQVQELCPALGQETFGTFLANALNYISQKTSCKDTTVCLSPSNMKGFKVAAKH